MGKRERRREGRKKGEVVSSTMSFFADQSLSVNQRRYEDDAVVFFVVFLVFLLFFFTVFPLRVFLLFEQDNKETRRPTNRRRL